MSTVPSLTLKIYQLFGEFVGEGPLSGLFSSLLDYRGVGSPLATRNWPEPLRELLAAAPVLHSTAGAHDDFHVIYCRLAAASPSLTDERHLATHLLHEHPYALFVFSNAAQDLWHFVNVKTVAPRGRGRTVRPLVRRIVVGPGEERRTAAERFAELDLSRAGGDSASALAIQQVHDEAFDVEKVTREFYAQYRKVFADVEQRIAGFGPDAEAKRLFTQRLFHRLMFVAFVQKKGWIKLHGDTDYLRRLWKEYVTQREDQPEYCNNFYRDRLLVLYYDGFNSETDRVAIADREFMWPRGCLSDIIGEVPYFNCALFERDPDDSRPGLEVPDDAIELILEGLFWRFNFTITEATPLEVEVAVDPEMLGKVFEELVTGRHESGSYYTPKNVVSFMCREALKGYLHSAAPHEDVGAIDRYVDEHDASALHDGEALLRALKEVTACDPACGSGAYLLGMLHELLDLRAALFRTGKLDPVSVFERKKEIIGRNVYGADMDEFAVQTARLRLWLSLVVDFEREDPTDRLIVLPNLEFKIKRGDSLAAPMERQFMLAEDFVRALEGASDEFLMAWGSPKRELEARIRGLEAELTRWAHGGANVEGLDWVSSFPGVLARTPSPAARDSAAGPGGPPVRERGAGFDIVLANPPYVRMERFKEKKPQLRRNFSDVHADRADLYVYFYARALELLAPDGMLVFISSNKWFRAGYGAKLRKYLGERTEILSITDFGHLPVFKSATAYPMIFVARKKASGGDSGPLFTQVGTLDPPYPDITSLVRESGLRLAAGAVRGSEWRVTIGRSAPVARDSTVPLVPLRDYANGEILRGIVSGCNAAFVVDEMTRDAILDRDPAAVEVIKPLCVGRDVRRWRVDSAQKWLIYMPHGIDAARYPGVISHLEKFRDRLEARSTSQPWYELQQPQERYVHHMERPKIVTPDIGKDLRFALDRTGRYPTNSVYFIPSSDLYLLGILNSSVVEEFYSTISAQIRGGYLRFFRQYVERIPIPLAGDEERATIAKTVERVLAMGGKGLDSALLESELNERVSALYQGQFALAGGVG